jgi:ATP-dependent RNA helicase RhlE
VVDRPLSANGRGGRVKQYIDPNKFIRGAVAVEQEEYIPQNRFEDFQVHKKIIGNLLAKGYETPTPIQDQTIKLVLEGKDVVGIANTGTGKTAAFAVPLIHDLVTNMDNRMLVLAPTRELAQQIVEEMLSFSKGLGFKIALIIGGVSINPQIKTLKQFPRIVVGTPGRIKDHIGQGTIDLSRFNRVVLDEVDRMLDMGFIRDITAILSKVNPKRQSLFFSATMEPEIEALISRFSHNAERVSTRTSVTADSVDQNVIWYRDKDDKIERLHELLIKGDRGKTIIFDDTKRLVERLGKELAARGFKVDRIHGDKSQAQRSRAIARLKSGEIDILVATDVAARGLDVSDVTHVVNFSQPNTYDDYVHRIGRTGRAGKTGQAYTFVQKE